MKKQTIYKIICGLMMSSALIASNDDPVTPKAKAAISRQVAALPYSPFSKGVIEQDLIAQERQKKQDMVLQAQAQKAQEELTREAENKRRKEAEQHQKELEDLHKQLEALNVSKTANESELISLRSNLESLRVQNETLQADKKKLEEEQTRINDDIRTKTDEITKLSTDLITAQTASDQDSTKIHELLENLKNRKHVIETLSKSLTETREQYDAKSKELSKKTIEATELEQKLKTSEEKLKQTQEKLSTVKDHVFKTGVTPVLVPGASSAPSGNSAIKSTQSNNNRKNITAIGDE
ncbi:MAG: hypothetical protein BGO77_02905 [Caedibacter sp. 37-49]|nr:MAG: hypothetical protein BGO77_02905 [Caedibacter sp. 37-49]